MKYFKYRDEWSGIENSTTYVEEEEGGEVRRITYNGDTYLASNVIGPDGHLNIADGSVEYDKWADEEGGSESGLIRITKEEFDAVWEPYLATRQSEWNRAKLTYPVGLRVNGVTHRFLPKGEIVELGNGVLGIIDYLTRKPQILHPQGTLTTIVKGYDEENQWIILEYSWLHPKQSS
jgi:hypothetical protein